VSELTAFKQVSLRVPDTIFVAVTPETKPSSPSTRLPPSNSYKRYRVPVLHPDHTVTKPALLSTF
jgi:hypothetical protein